MAHEFDKKWRSKDVIVLDNVDFSSMLLCNRVLAGLDKAGFKKPSPIQLEAIPTGRFGKDLLVQAKSGTGKTLVFVIVALEMLHRKIFRPQVLILVPTREIATQICSVVKSVSSYFPKLTCESFIGGFPVAHDVRKAHNCQIVVGTPGRLKQLIQMKALLTSSIRLFVFDEADQVFSIAWLDDIDFIFNSLPDDKQVIAASATYPPKLKRVVIKYLRDPYLAQIDTSKLALLGITHYIKIVESSAMPIRQYRFKLAALESILKIIKFTQCLVYCNGIYKVQTLYRDIKKWGFSTTYISSDRDQAERLKAIDCLKRFKCKVLVSSNVTARGIDAENVDLVINFDVSSYPEIYLHRSGRAGRYGSKGATISICNLYELKFFENIEKNAYFKNYELPDPVPADLIQNPVLDNYAIKVTDDVLENSNEVAEELSVLMNENSHQKGTNFEQCGNQSNNVHFAITEDDERDSKVLVGVSIPDFFMKKSSENNTSSVKESESSLINLTSNEKINDDNIHLKIIDKLDGKIANSSNKNVNTLNLREQNISEDYEGNIVVSVIEDGIPNALSDSKNAIFPENSYDAVKTNSIVNECYDKKTAESLTSENKYLVNISENSDIINVREPTLEFNELQISNSMNAKDNENNVQIKSSDNDNESSLLSSTGAISEIFSTGDNLSSVSYNSDVACAKDSESFLVGFYENDFNINYESTLLTNELNTKISVEQDSSNNSQMNEIQSVIDLSKSGINIAIENYVREYESRKLTVLADSLESLEFKSSTAENSVSKNNSVSHISDLNSSRCGYYYKVFQLFLEVHSSKQSDSVKEAVNKTKGSPVKKESCIQEPTLGPELSSVEKHSTTCTVLNKTTSESINNELKFESSFPVPDTLVQEVPSKNNDDNILICQTSPRYVSTPHFEKSKHIIGHLLGKDSIDPPERSMSFFNEVSGESASEIESYETTHTNPSSYSSSDSESDSVSCTESSSSSWSVSSTDDDNCSDQDSTETSSSESHSSVDSLSVHSIEYSCKKGMKSHDKYSHPDTFKQKKTSLKKHQQISHFECSKKRQQYHSKICPSPFHSEDFFTNSHQCANNANYFHAEVKPKQFIHSKFHQASTSRGHSHRDAAKNTHEKSNFFSCNGQHSTTSFMPSKYRCHPYHDNTLCDQRAICDHVICCNNGLEFNSKIHQNPCHSKDFSKNLHQHAHGAKFSNAKGKPNQFTHSKVHQACSNGQHFHCDKGKSMPEKNSSSFQFSCNGQHSSACFMPSEHRCHFYYDNVSCDQRAICDQWCKIFFYQWQHIQNCNNINF